MTLPNSIVAVYSYTIGVFITGVFVQQWFPRASTVFLLAIAAVVSLAWVAYFYQFIQPRLDDD